MAFASPADVAAVLQIDEDDLPEGVETLLDLATGVIEGEFASASLALIVPTAVRAVCAQMVARVVQNPDGVSSETYGGYATAFDSDHPDDLLFLTDEERRWLSPWGGQDAGTIKTPSAVVQEFETQFGA